MSRRTMRVYMMDLLATVPYYTAYLSRALQERGVDVRVGSITYYLDPGCFRSRGLRLDPGCLDVVGRFAALPRTVRRVAKLLETVLNLSVLLMRFLVRPPDILHVQYLPMLRSRWPLDWWFVRLLRWRGTRVVLTVHDLLPHDTADRYRALFQRLYSGVDRMICHSSVVAERLEDEFAAAPGRISVIPHGPFFYDLPGSENAHAVRARYGIQPGQQVVLWQGIIFPYKGLNLLLEAWSVIEPQTADATLLVVGTGSAEITAEVRAQVTRLGLKRVVLDLRFLSAEELTALYRAAAVVVYPYRAITTSGALATGVALGKAVVASDLPVFRELLTDGEDALLVKPGDAAALAAATLRVLRDAALRGRPEARRLLGLAASSREVGLAILEISAPSPCTTCHLRYIL